jgi:hypothetical protein
MATVRRSRNLIVLVLPLAVLAGTASPAAARHHSLGGCGAPAGSAINEYCDVIPSQSGGSAPKVGNPSVATTLPPRIVRAIEAGPSAQRKLLTLPAAHKRTKRHKLRTAALVGPATSVWSLSLTLILILAALALALVAIAFERRRRQRTPPPA